MCSMISTKSSKHALKLLAAFYDLTVMELGKAILIIGRDVTTQGDAVLVGVSLPFFR
jgi:hypothetical protein